MFAAIPTSSNHYELQEESPIFHTGEIPVKLYNIYIDKRNSTAGGDGYLTTKTPNGDQSNESALSETLEKIKNKEVGIQIIHKSVGLVTESDVLLAAASGAVVIAFHVQVDSNAKLQAQQAGVDIRSYNVIYNAEEEVKMALEGLLEPEIKEEIVGRAVVLEMFKIPKQGFIAGSRVDEGIILRGAKARLIRDNEVIHEGTVTSLKRFKDDVKEIKEGMECGIGIDGAGKFKEDDVIVVYEIQSIKRTLEV